VRPGGLEPPTNGLKVYYHYPAAWPAVAKLCFLNVAG